MTLAADLKELNDSRKEMTEEGVEEAVRQIESSSWKDDQVLVVYLPKCHEVSPELLREGSRNVIIVRPLY